MTAVTPIAFFLAAVIITRVICVLYHLNKKTHSRGKWHFHAFGYSYVALGAGAACAVAAIATPSNDSAILWADWSIWLFLSGSVGLIAFDRRPRRGCDAQRTQVG